MILSFLHLEALDYCLNDLMCKVGIDTNETQH